MRQGWQFLGCAVHINYASWVSEVYSIADRPGCSEKPPFR